MQKQLGIAGGGGGGVTAHLPHIVFADTDATGIAAMTAKLSIARNFFMLNFPVLKRAQTLFDDSAILPAKL
jgi:hypothetical protein